MINSIMLALGITAPVAYLMYRDIKTQKIIARLSDDIKHVNTRYTEINNYISNINNTYSSVADNSKIAYDILKSNCRKMGTCHLFK
jgi:hypothetical protein